MLVDSKEKREEREKKIFKEMKDENSPNLMKDGNVSI